MSKSVVFALLASALGAACERAVVPDASAAVQCTSGAPQSFPSFDRTCTQSSDCFVAIHQSDCCGTLMASGINASQSTAFQAAERTCRSMYPGCGCPPGGLFAEDGVQLSVDHDTSMAHAECIDGACRVRVRDVPCGDVVCAPGQVCVHECASDGGTAPPPHCVDVPAACSARLATCACLGADACAHGCATGVRPRTECACP